MFHLPSSRLSYDERSHDNDNDDYDNDDDDDDVVVDDDDDDDDNESASSRLPRVIRLRSIAMRRTIVHQTLKYLSLP